MRARAARSDGACVAAHARAESGSRARMCTIKACTHDRALGVDADDLDDAELHLRGEGSARDGRDERAQTPGQRHAIERGGGARLQLDTASYMQQERRLDICVGGLSGKSKSGRRLRYGAACAPILLALPMQGRVLRDRERGGS